MPKVKRTGPDDATVTDKARSTPPPVLERKSSDALPPPVRPHPRRNRGLKKRGLWDETDPGGPSQIIHPKKASYLPAVPSPLRADGSSEVSDDQVERSTSLKRYPTRRSLHVRVIDTGPPPEPRLYSDEDLKNALNASLRSQTPLLRNASPSTSLQSVGKDFSRYPTRKPSSSLLASTGSPSIPLGIPVSESGEASPFGNFFTFDSSDPERGFSPYAQRRGYGVTYPAPDEKEDDDDLHNPNEVDKRKPGMFNWRLLVTILSTAVFVTGLLMLFILWPILTYAVGRGSPSDNDSERLSDFDYPIIGSIRTSMIDPDTPEYAMTRESVLGRGKLKLVFSDEFNQNGRTFYPGEDQFWEAANLHYAATQDLEWYDPDAVTTNDGTLQLRLDTFRNHDLDYRSGMLQSWNKLCFKGGVLEVSASLAGPAGVPGLWPGIWTLGNLARPGYRATSDGVWPYSYDQCDAGITPNQSSTDGISYLPGQRLAKCVCDGEDHPNPGTGRGAPEIDSLEGTAEYKMRVGVATQSSQVVSILCGGDRVEPNSEEAPFDVWYQTDHQFLAINNYEVTQMNGWQGGPFQQAVSGVTMLNNDWYDGVQFQKYAFEYIPGQEDGAIAWFIGDEETFRMTGNAIRPNGNVGQRDISREPMSIVLNLGFSPSWTWIDWAALEPRLSKGTVMYIDYVRIYQEEGEELLSCDPPGYPTTDYIRNHLRPYMDANLTVWDDSGFPWPKNKLMDGCD